MVKSRSKASTIISVSAHILLAVALVYSSQSVTFLVPTRPDGIEVSLVAANSPTSTVRTLPPAVTTVKTLDTPAEVNLKQNQPQPAKAQPQPPAPAKAKVTAKAEPQAEPAPVHTQKPNVAKPLNKKAQVNDLLGDALSDNTHALRKGKALGGKLQGTSNSNNLDGNYADLVVNAVRPFVIMPDDLSAKAVAIVQVEIYPNLNVKSIKLLKSSGNPEYDQNVQTAINRVKVFPPLPEGAQFVDYRILKLTFRPE